MRFMFSFCWEVEGVGIIPFSLGYLETGLEGCFLFFWVNCPSNRKRKKLLVDYQLLDTRWTGRERESDPSRRRKKNSSDNKRETQIAKNASHVFCFFVFKYAKSYICSSSPRKQPQAYKKNSPYSFLFVCFACVPGQQTNVSAFALRLVPCQLFPYLPSPLAAILRARILSCHHDEKTAKKASPRVSGFPRAHCPAIEW